MSHNNGSYSFIHSFNVFVNQILNGTRKRSEEHIREAFHHLLENVLLFIYLEKDDGKEQIQAIFGSAAVLLWCSPSSPSFGKQHPFLLPPLLPLWDAGWWRGEGSGGDSIKGEDFGAGSSWGACEGTLAPQGHLLTPFLHRVVLLFDAYNGTQSGGDVGETGGRTASPILTFLFFHLRVSLKLFIHLSLEFSLCLRGRDAAVSVTHLQRGNKGLWRNYTSAS